MYFGMTLDTRGTRPRVRVKRGLLEVRASDASCKAPPFV
jgi:hypothetical protein